MHIVKLHLTDMRTKLKNLFKGRVSCSIWGLSLFCLIRTIFSYTFSAKLDKVEPGKVQISVAFDKRLSQQHGGFHAGVIATLADNAGGFAALSLFDETDGVVTTNFQFHFIALAVGAIAQQRPRDPVDRRRVRAAALRLAPNLQQVAAEVGHSFEESVGRDRSQLIVRRPE